MRIILEKLKKFESENSMLTDLITDLEGKIVISRSFVDQETEIDKLIKNEEPDTEESAQIQKYHYATYNKYLDDEKEESDFPRMTEKWINKFLCSNYKLYYRTHELNECLYLHFKGFRQIENLHTFTNLKVLYMEGNAIKKIENLDLCVNLMSLYLHQNLIEKIEGLENLKLLSNLNLSENCITTIENLDHLPNLSNLLLKRNRIGINGIDDLKGLNGLKNLSVLDISENRIDFPEVKENLTQIPDIRVVYLQGNECIRKIPHYRKTLISQIKSLRYLDDKPVFEDERRFSEAYARGGLDEEKKEREAWRKEKQDAELQRIQDFREMIDAWKGKNSEKIEEVQETDEEKQRKEKEKEEQKRKLLQKCKVKSNKMEIKEESITLDTKGDVVSSQVKKPSTQIYDDDYDLPDLETVKNKKQEGYVEYVLEKEKYNLESNNEEVVDTTFITNKENIDKNKANFDELD